MGITMTWAQLVRLLKKRRLLEKRIANHPEIEQQKSTARSSSPDSHAPGSPARPAVGLRPRPSLLPDARSIDVRLADLMTYQWGAVEAMCRADVRGVEGEERLRGRSSYARSFGLKEGSDAQG